MTTDEYLRACNNVPPLPRGWFWEIRTEKNERESVTRPGEMIQWVYHHIDIIDREGVIQGRSMEPIMQKTITDYPHVIDMKLADGLRRAYNSMYSSEKVNYYKALGIVPPRG